MKDAWDATRNLSFEKGSAPRGELGTRMVRVRLNFALRCANIIMDHRRTPPNKIQPREIQHFHNLVGALHEAPAEDRRSPLRHIINITSKHQKVLVALPQAPLLCKNHPFYFLSIEVYSL